MATIDQRSKGSWRARVRIPGYPAKSRTFDTRAEAEVWADRIERQLRAGVDTIPNIAAEPTLSEALARYEQEVTPQKRGHEQERRRIAQWRQRELAQLKLSRLTSQHLVQFRDQRLKEGIAANTIRLDLSLISNLFSIARTEWGMPYLTNPVTYLRQPKPAKGRDRRLDAEEGQRFQRAIETCYNKMIPLAIRFALETAARQGEILKLTWDDIDLERRVMILRDTKNGDDRRVPLTQTAVAILEELQREKGKGVFKLTRDAIAAGWRRILERANIENFRYHDLRHEATTRLFERGLEVMEVQRITGHKTLSMLLRYTQMDVARIVDRLDETESNRDRASPRTSPRSTRATDATRGQLSNQAINANGKVTESTPVQNETSPILAKDTSASKYSSEDESRVLRNVIQFNSRR